MIDIKAEAKRKVAVIKAKRLRASMNSKLQTLHRFNNHNYVLCDSNFHLLKILSLSFLFYLKPLELRRRSAEYLLKPKCNYVCIVFTY